MGKLKRTLALVSTVALLSTLVVMPSAAFASWEVAGMTFIADGGHTNLVDPEAGTEVNRGETGYMLGSVLGLDADYGDKCFTDDAGVDAGVVAMVERLCDLAIVKGKSAGLYAYGDQPTKGEIGKMIVNGAHISPEKCELPAAYLADMPEWMVTEATAHNADLTIAEALYCSGTMTGEGDGSSGSMNTAIYATVATMLEREFGAAVVVPGEPPVVEPGVLTITLDDSPDSDSVPQTANANFAKVTLEGKATLDSLTLTRGGDSSIGDIENLKLLDADGNKYGNTVTGLNSDHKAKFVFSGGLDVDGTMELWVRAGVASGATTNNTISVCIDSGDDVDLSSGSATVEGDSCGSEMTVTGTSIGTITVNEDTVTSDSTPDAGAVDSAGDPVMVTLNSIEVVAGSVEGVMIEDITVSESGTASLSDYGAIQLYDLGSESVVAETSWNSEGDAVFSLDMEIPKSGKFRAEVRTEVVSGAGQTMNCDFTDGSDVMLSAYGTQYGYYISPTVLAGWTGKGTNDQTINSGALNIGDSAMNPGGGNITQATDQLLRVWNFEAVGEGVRVSSFEVDFDFGGGMVHSELTNIYLTDSEGEVVAGPGDAAAANNVVFSDVFDVPVGDNDYYLYATIADTTTAGDTVQADIDATAALTLKGVSTGDDITAGGGPFELSGDTMAIQEGTFTAITLTQPAARSIAGGVDDFIFATFAINASNSGEDVVITNVALQNTLGDAGDEADKIDNVEIWCDIADGNSSRGDVYESKQSWGDNFSDTGAAAEDLAINLDTNFTVEKNTVVVCAVLADLAAGATAGDKHQIGLDGDAGDVNGYGKSTGNSIGTIVASGAGQVMTVAASGTLALTVETNPLASFFHGGQTDVLLASFRLDANSVESLDLEQFLITDDGADDTVEFYKFYVDDVLLGTLPGGGTAELFLTEGTVTIPADGHVTVDVKADLAAVDGITVTSNSTLEVTIADADDIETTGNASNSDVNNAAPVGNNGDAATHKVFEAWPKIQLADGTLTDSEGNSPSSAALVGNTILPGAEQLVAIFAVTAMGDEDVVFGETAGNNNNSCGDANESCLSVQIGGSRADDAGASDDTFTVRDASGTTLYTKANDDFDGNPQLNVDFSGKFQVPAGGTEFLYIYMETADYEDEGDSIQVWLEPTAADVSWNVLGDTTEYTGGDVINRGNIMGTALNKT